MSVKSCSPRVSAWLHIRQIICTHVTTIICNAFAPRIRGIQGVTYLKSPWFEGNIFDVTEGNIAMSPSLYEGFVEGSIFIIKFGGFDHGFYLLQQLKEIIYSKG